MTQFDLNPHQIYTNVIGSPNFRRELTTTGLDHLTNEQVARARQAALAKGALQCAEIADRANNTRSFEGSMYRLVAQFDSFMGAKYRLDDLKNRVSGSTRQEKLPSLRTVTTFNHIIQDIIDQGGHHLRFSDLEKAVSQLFRITHTKDEADAFSVAMSERLGSMRQESGFEQIVGALDVEYERATVEQELDDGIDITIFYRNTTIPVDVKSSQFGADRVNFAGYHDTKLTLWTGLENDDFQDTFRIPYELAVQKGGELKQVLDTYVDNRRIQAV